MRIKKKETAHEARWLGILLMGITVPIFLTALTGQEPGKEETADRLAKEQLRLTNAIADETEALAELAGGEKKNSGRQAKAQETRRAVDRRR